jgi:hypothetical protein
LEEGTALLVWICGWDLLLHDIFAQTADDSKRTSMFAGMDSDSASREAPQPAPGSANPSSTGTATASSSISSSSSAEAVSSAEQQQQQPALKGVEDRLSFLEMELLKLTLQPDAQQQLLLNPAAGITAAPPATPAAAAAATSSGLDPAAAAAAGYGTPGPWGWPGYDAADSPDSQPGPSLISQPELLDPEVLAIAEALLIRKGLPYSAAAFAAGPGVAGRGQQQQQRVRTPSSIWGRRHAAQQLRTKPWRYADDPAAAAAAAAASTQGLMPYGYQPNNDASLICNNRGASTNSSMGRAGRLQYPGGVPGPDGYYGNFPADYRSFPASYDPRYGPGGYPAGYDPAVYDGLMGPEGGPAGEDLTPYEPSGWAVAGTVLVVYAGVLLTFFALLAGAGDVGAAVDPADVMLWW